VPTRASRPRRLDSESPAPDGAGLGRPTPAFRVRVMDVQYGLEVEWSGVIRLINHILCTSFVYLII